MNLSTYVLSIVRLAADEPDRARDEVGQAMAHWSRGGLSRSAQRPGVGAGPDRALRRPRRVRPGT